MVNHLLLLRKTSGLFHLYVPFSLIAKQEEITDIFLGEQEPHLTLQFTSGVLLTIFGVDNLYESWQAGTDSQDWLVVACPGGDVAVWSPENEENI